MTGEIKKKKKKYNTLVDTILIWVFGEQNYSSRAAQDPVIRTNNLILSFVEHLLCIGSHVYFLCFQQFYNGRYYNFTFLNMFHSISKPQFS